MSVPRLGIGVDVGGTFIKLGVVDEHGSIVSRRRAATDAEHGPDAVLALVAAEVTKLLEEYGDRVASVGLGVPGVINARGEISHPPNLPGWQVVPVAERLRPLLARPLAIAVENDANVAALAEARAGSGAHDPTFLFITLGTGIGGCVIINRSIWRGGGGGAGEVGHVSIDANGPICGCGARGCIEAYLGQRFMTALARERISRAPSSSLYSRATSDADLTPRHLIEAADGGDVVVRDIFAELGGLLGAALASVLNVCDLSLVIVGGGVSNAGEHLLEPARRSARARALRSIASRIELRRATLGNDSGLIGAALLGLDAVRV